MNDLNEQPAHFAASFSAGEVFDLCQQSVYPSCNKLSGPIFLRDRIADDLGYIGEGANVLAVTTNQTFQMLPSEKFSATDFSQLETVQDHALEVCKRLAKEGRLVPHDEREAWG